MMTLVAGFDFLSEITIKSNGGYDLSGMGEEVGDGDEDSGDRVPCGYVHWSTSLFPCITTLCNRKRQSPICVTSPNVIYSNCGRSFNADRIAKHEVCPDI